MAEVKKGFSQKYPALYEVGVLTLSVFLGLMVYNLVQTQVMPKIMPALKA